MPHTHTHTHTHHPTPHHSHPQTTLTHHSHTTHIALHPHTNMHLQITYQSCGRVSERKEKYRDLTVALSRRPTLENVIKDTYIE